MLSILTRQQMRAFDRHAIEVCAVPGLILMENAGRGAAARLLQRYPNATGPVVIVCGGGNNGGDGFVIARQLLAAGANVEVFIMSAADRIAGDARINYAALCGVGHRPVLLEHDMAPLRGALAKAHVVVDALLGTGLSRPLQGRWREVIAILNEAPAPRVALDIPSGIDADSGAILGAAVTAAVTLTFGAYKCGLLQGPAIRHVGDIEVVDLGVPAAAIIEQVGSVANVMTRGCLKAALRPRARDIHKYQAGNVLVIAGSEGKTGAALLCAEATLRAGAGMATIASFPVAVAIMQPQVREVMTLTLDPDAAAGSLTQALLKRTAVAVGPGMGLDERARQVSEQLVAEFVGPVVIDADAISHFAGHPEAIKDSPGPRMLTPHSGELARLLGCTSAEVEADRFEAARDAANRTGAVVLLKGYRTVVAAPDGRMSVCLQGSPVLATAGSGDTLCGIIAALACHNEAYQATVAGCMWHALAGEHWRTQQRFDRGMVAGDISAALVAAAAALMAP